MKKTLILLAAIVLLGCTAESNERAGRGIDWIEDYHQGLSRARESGKAMMLFFTADWCPPCWQMKKDVFSDPKVIDASADLVNIMIDVDKDRRTLMEYRVRGIPVIFFLSAGGKTVAKLEGPSGVADIVKHMRAVREKNGKGST